MIRNLILGFVALATAAKEGLPLVPLWTLSAHPSITLYPSNKPLLERKRRIFTIHGEVTPCISSMKYITQQYLILKRS